LKGKETHQKYLEQQLDKEVERYSCLVKQYEELKSSLNIDEIQVEIRDIQRSINKLKFDYDLIESIKQERSTEVNES